jgi:calcineurin-like phosphoesterase family protein
MKVFYTSDTHFGHKNILKYCSRPFVDVADMGRGMIERWNETVGADDVVYHLGDFGFGSKNQLRDIVKSLNGHKIIIRGNHDRGLESLKEMGFEASCNSMERDDGGIRWLLIHNPYNVTADNVLCGHIHEKWRRIENMINVGVDVWDFRPRTIEELLASPQSMPKTIENIMAERHKKMPQGE